MAIGQLDVSHARLYGLNIVRCTAEFDHSSFAIVDAKCGTWIAIAWLANRSGVDDRPFWNLDFCLRVRHVQFRQVRVIRHRIDNGEVCVTHEADGGIDNTSRRVLHGGAWFHTSPVYLRAAARYEVWPTYTDSVLGFRCVVSFTDTPNPP